MKLNELANNKHTKLKWLCYQDAIILNIVQLPLNGRLDGENWWAICDGINIGGSEANDLFEWPAEVLNIESIHDGVPKGDLQ